METDERGVEAICRSFLLNAAARQVALARVAPEAPSVDYLTGFSAGREAGGMETLALILSALTGESAARLVEEALTQASVDGAFPFELHVELADSDPAATGGRADSGPA